MSCGIKVQEIEAGELAKKIKSATNLQIINVLDKEYFDDCHITGSINVPLTELKSRAENWDKDVEIVLYCAHKMCSASSEAYNILCNMGFKKVSAYENGMKDWLHAVCQQKVFAK